MMNIPGFTAESALGRPSRIYHGSYLYSLDSGALAGVHPSQSFNEGEELEEGYVAEGEEADTSEE